jgi:hypothetical protein
MRNAGYFFTWLMRLVDSILPRKTGFNSRPFRMRFVANKVAPVQVFLWALQFPPGSIVPPVLNIQSFTYHRRCMSATDSVIN